MEGRRVFVLTVSPFALQKHKLTANAFRYKLRFLRERQNLFCDESEAAGAPTPETTGSGRARGKRPT